MDEYVAGGSEALVVRMIASATAFRSDANFLSAQVAAASNASALLNLIAFEILLKALLAARGIPVPFTHDYAVIFSTLPIDVRDRVATLADERDPMLRAGSRIAELLPEFASNFTSLRYPYEAYVACSDDAYESASVGWVAAGAPEADAVHRYYPGELFAISDGLLQVARDTPPKSTD